MIARNVDFKNHSVDVDGIKGSISVMLLSMVISAEFFYIFIRGGL